MRGARGDIKAAKLKHAHYIVPPPKISFIHQKCIKEFTHALDFRVDGSFELVYQQKEKFVRFFGIFFSEVRFSG